MSKAIKGALIFTAFYFLQKAATFLLLPLYTSYLTPSDYGKIGVSNSLSSVLSILFLLALNGPIVRFFHDDHSDPQYIRKLWGASLMILSVWSAVLLLFLVSTQGLLLKRIVGEDLVWPIGYIAIASAFFSPAFILYQAFLQTQEKARQFATNNAVYFLAVTFGSIILVVVFRAGALGVLMSSLVVNFVFFLYSLIKIVPQASFRIDVPMSKSVLAYSLPLVPHALSGWITGMMDRLFIAKQMDTYSVGIYNVAYQVSFALVSIAVAINQAFMPWFHARMRDGSQASLLRIRAVTEICIAGYMVVATFVSIWAEELLSLVVNKTFSEASQYVPMLMSSAVWGGIYFFLSAPIFYNKSATRKLPVITFGCSLVNILGNIFLIRYMNVSGAAVTSFAGNLASGIAVGMYSRTFSPVPYRLSLIFSSAILFGITPFIKLATGDQSILLKAGVTVASMAAGYYLFRESIESVAYPVLRKALGWRVSADAS